MSIVKSCKKHGELTIDQVKQEKSKNGKIRYRCHACKIETDRRWKANNKEKHIASSTRWKKENREHYNECTRTDRKRNPEKYRLQAKRYREKMGSNRNVKEISRLRGISTEKYNKMLVQQGYKCAICNMPEQRVSRSGKIAQLCLDHDHVTGEVRAFLCHNCNTMIGKFKDSEEIIESAIKYLSREEKVCKK